MSNKLPRKLNTQPQTAGVPTPELCDRICAGIAKGLHPRVGAELAGVSAQTFESWLEEGKKGIEPYATFRTAISHADAKLHSQVIGSLVDSLETNPPMALKFAERRWPNEWAPPSAQRDEAAFHAAFAINIHISSREEDDGPVCNLHHSHTRECHGYPPAVILSEYTNVTREPEQPPRDRGRDQPIGPAPAQIPSPMRPPTKAQEWNAEVRSRPAGYVIIPPKKKPNRDGSPGGSFLN